MFDTVSEEEFKKYFESISKRLSVHDRLLTAIELPATGFDMTSCLSNNITDFGISSQSDKIGQVALYIGYTVINPESIDRKIVLNNTIGVIAAQANGRIVLLTDYGFFGWLYPDEFNMITHNTFSNQVH